MLQGRRSKQAERRNPASPDEDDAYEGTPRVTSRVGADLRAARERVGWTLPSVAAHLRIRLPFLEAIEDGRIGDLPGNAYAVGFLRTYAQSLGLDPDEIARRFKAEAAEVNRKTELAFPAPVPERGIPAGAVVLLGVVIAIGAYIGWYRMSGSDRPAVDAVQPVPERLAPLAATAAPTQSPLVPLSTAPSSPAGSALSSPIMPPSAPSSFGSSSFGSSSFGSSSFGSSSFGSSSFGSSSFASAPPQSGNTAAPIMGPPVPPTLLSALAPAGQNVSAFASSAASAGGVPMPPSSPATISGMPDGTRIVVRAKSDAWVQVREKQGQVLLNRVLRSGETWPVPPNKAQLLLTTGNAAGTELLLDGVAMPPLGTDGAVRRDLPLDPDSIRDGKLALQSPSPKPAAPVSRTN